MLSEPPDIRPRIRPHLRELSDWAIGPRTLDRARVEHWLAVQIGYLGVRLRPIIWADGPRAAWQAIVGETWKDFARHAAWLAEQVASGTARPRRTRFGAWPLPFHDAAIQSAEHIVDGWISEHFQDAVDDPRLARWMDGVWRTRRQRDRAGKTRSWALSEAWLGSRQDEFVGAAVTAVYQKSSCPGEPVGWSDAWRDGWTGKWAVLKRPAGRRGDSIDENLADLLDGAGNAASTAVLQGAWAALTGATIDRQRDVVYGAWVALSELNAGPPLTDLEDWRGCLRRYWRPFYEQATGGLGWCWFTPESVICLPRPMCKRIGDRLLATWPNGEETES